MKNSTFLLCLGLDGMGAYFASLTPEDWLRIALVILSLISVASSFILKAISKIREVKEKKADPLTTAESLIQDAHDASEEAKEILQSLKKQEKKTSIYRVEEKK